MKNDQPKTEQELVQEFLADYKKLSEKHGMRLVISPAWRYSEETRDFRMVLQESVGRLPKQ